jgi:hypothetical protein
LPMKMFKASMVAMKLSPLLSKRTPAMSVVITLESLLHFDSRSWVLISSRVSSMLMSAWIK